MYTFKSIIEDFERPLNTSLEDSIHMPQNHDNRPKRRSRRYAEHRHANNAGLVQTTGAVPPAPEQRHVAPPTLTNTGAVFPEPTYGHVPSEGYTRTKPAASLDERSFEAHSKNNNGGEQNMPSHMRQATSPLKMMFGKGPSRPHYTTRTSSGPIFDEVLRLRADVRERVIGDVDDGTKRDAQGKDTGKSKKQDEPRAEVAEEPVRSRTPDSIPDMEMSEEIDNEVFRLQNEIATDVSNDITRDAKGKGKATWQDEPRAEVKEEPARSEIPEFIPDMEISGENWAEPLYELAATEHGTEQQSREAGPIHALSNAMNELSVFQGIGSPSRGDKVETEIAQFVNPARVPKSRAGAKADNLPSWGNGVHAKTQEKEVDKTDPSISASKHSSDSVKSFLSDDFEKVEKPTEEESEENGGKRKWYRGFRR